MATDPIGSAGLASQQLRPKGQPATEAARQTESTPEAAGTEAAASGGTGSEKIQISRKGREMLALKDLMASSRKTLDEHPDVRAERVREVRDRLRAGVYDTGAIRDELAHRLTSIFKDIPLD